MDTSKYKDLLEDLDIKPLPATRPKPPARSAVPPPIPVTRPTDMTKSELRRKLSNRIRNQDVFASPNNTSLKSLNDLEDMLQRFQEEESLKSGDNSPDLKKKIDIQKDATKAVSDMVSKIKKESNDGKVKGFSVEEEKSKTLSMEAKLKEVLNQQGAIEKQRKNVVTIGSDNLKQQNEKLLSQISTLTKEKDEATSLYEDLAEQYDKILQEKSALEEEMGSSVDALSEKVKKTESRYEEALKELKVKIKTLEEENLHLKDQHESRSIDFTNEKSEMSTELENLRKNCSQLEAKCAEYDANLERLQSQNESLKKDRENVDAELMQARENFKNMEEDHKKYLDESSVFKEENLALHTAMQDYQKEIESLKQEILDLQDREKDAADLEQKVETLTQERDSLVEISENNKERIHSTCKELDSAKVKLEELDSLKSQLLQAQSDFKEKAQEAEDLRAEKEKLSEELESIKVELDDKKNEIDSLHDTFSKERSLCVGLDEHNLLLETKNQAEDQLSKLEQELNCLHEKCKRLEAWLVEKENELMKVHEEKDALSEVNTTSALKIETLSNDLDEMKSKLKESEGKVSDDLYLMVKNLENKLADKDQKISLLTYERDSLFEKLDAVNQSHENLENSLKKEQARGVHIISKEDELKALNDKVLELQASLDHERETCKKLSEQLKEQDSVFEAKMNNTLDQLNMQQTNDVSELQKEITSLIAENESLKKAVETVAELQNQINEKDEKLQGLSSQLQKKEAHVKDINNEKDNVAFNDNLVKDYVEKIKFLENELLKSSSNHEGAEGKSKEIEGATEVLQKKETTEKGVMVDENDFMLSETKADENEVSNPMEGDLSNEGKDQKIVVLELRKSVTGLKDLVSKAQTQVEQLELENEELKNDLIQLHEVLEQDRENASACIKEWEDWGASVETQMDAVKKSAEDQISSLKAELKSVKKEKSRLSQEKHLTLAEHHENKKMFVLNSLEQLSKVIKEEHEKVKSFFSEGDMEIQSLKQNSKLDEKQRKSSSEEKRNSVQSDSGVSSPNLAARVSVDSSESDNKKRNTFFKCHLRIFGKMITNGSTSHSQMKTSLTALDAAEEISLLKQKLQYQRSLLENERKVTDSVIANKANQVNELQEQLETLERKYIVELKDIKEKHRNEIEKIRQDSEIFFEEEKRKLKIEHERELKNVERRHSQAQMEINESVNQMKMSYENNLAELREQHRKEIENLVKRHDIVLETTEKENLKEKNEMKAEINSLMEQLKKKISDAEEAEKVISEKIGSLQKQVEDAENSNKELSQKLKDIGIIYDKKRVAAIKEKEKCLRKEFEEKINRIEDEKSSAKELVKKLEGRCFKLESDIKNLKIKTEERIKNESESWRSKLEEMINVNDENLKAFKKDCDLKIKAAKARHREKIKELEKIHQKELLDCAEKELKNSEASNRDTINRLTLKIEEQEKLIQHNNWLENSKLVEKEKNAIKEAHEQIEILRGVNETLQEEQRKDLARIQDQIKQAERLLDDTRNESFDLQSQLNKLTERLDNERITFDKRFSEKDKKYQELLKELQQQKSIKKSQSKRISMLENDLDFQLETIEQLRTEKASLEKELEFFKIRLQGPAVNIEKSTRFNDVKIQRTNFNNEKINKFNEEDLFNVKQDLNSAIEKHINRIENLTEELQKTKNKP